MRIVAISAVAECLVAPSQALLDALTPFLPKQTRLAVIPDQVETRESFASARAKQLASTERAGGKADRAPGLVRRALRYLVYLSRNPRDGMALLYRKAAGAGARFKPGAALKDPVVPAADAAAPGSTGASPAARVKSVLWFGNYGAPHSDFGMLALLLAVPALRKVSRDIPLELVVVSNNAALFETCLATVGVRTRYVEWSEQAVFDEVARADVCLLPFGVDPFSVTKSANRAVLALAHGVPVVTTRLASMEPLADAVVFDDWEEGLRRYLGPEADIERAKSIAAARPLLERHFSASAIGRAWLRLLEGPPGRLRHGYLDAGASVEVAIFVQRPDDVALVLPMLDELRGRPAVFLRVLLLGAALQGGEAAMAALIERGMIPYALDEQGVIAGEDRILRNVDALVIAHRDPRETGEVEIALATSAGRLGVATFVTGAHSGQAVLPWRDGTSVATLGDLASSEAVAAAADRLIAARDRLAQRGEATSPDA